MNRDNSVIVRLRTRNDLRELLKAGRSGEWKIGKNKEKEIYQVQIFNWDGSLVLQASFDISQSSRTEDKRLIVGFSTKDARIIKCDPPLKWMEQAGRNPVKYA
jgi:uncharacterized protein YjhX (UPF0386 family)